jgi:hypothetical protein
MKQRLTIAVLTIVLLGAGYAAGIWSERQSCKVPAPPPLLTELSGKNRPALSNKSPLSPPDPTTLAAEIEKMRPQIDTFRARMEQIDGELDKGMETFLRPDQLVVYNGLRKKWAEGKAKDEAAASTALPLSTEEIVNLQQRPLYKLLGVVVVAIRTDWLTKELNLDDAQKAQLRQLLLQRREKFLALVDTLPPPSLLLSRLAPMAQRLVDPNAATAKPADSAPAK